VLALSEELDESAKGTQSGTRNAVQVVFNWFTELNEKVPVDAD
jgi:hypothetical protein